MRAVRKSDLDREGRWDAEFHIALKELAGSIEALRSRYDDEQAAGMVDAIGLGEKAALSILRTGSHRGSLTTAEAHAVTRRYPHLSLALIGRDAQQAVATVQDRIARDQRALDLLLEISHGMVSPQRAAG